MALCRRGRPDRCAVCCRRQLQEREPRLQWYAKIARRRSQGVLEDGQLETSVSERGEKIARTVGMNHTASNEVVHQRLLALEQEFMQHFSPIVSVLHKLVLKKVDPSALVSTVVRSDIDKWIRRTVWLSRHTLSSQGILSSHGWISLLEHHARAQAPTTLSHRYRSAGQPRRPSGRQNPGSNVAISANGCLRWDACKDGCRSCSTVGQPT